MFGQQILITGPVLVVVGAVVLIVEALGRPLGRLAGDIRARVGGWSCSLPIMTSIVVSTVLTILLNAVFWLFRR